MSTPEYTLNVVQPANGIISAVRDIAWYSGFETGNLLEGGFEKLDSTNDATVPVPISSLVTPGLAGTNYTARFWVPEVVTYVGRKASLWKQIPSTVPDAFWAHSIVKLGKHNSHFMLYDNHFRVLYFGTNITGQYIVIHGADFQDGLGWHWANYTSTAVAPLNQELEVDLFINRVQSGEARLFVDGVEVGFLTGIDLVVQSGWYPHIVIANEPHNTDGLAGGTIDIDEVSIGVANKYILTCVPNTKYTLTNWVINGVLSGNQNPLSLTLTANTTVEALLTFNATPVTLPFNDQFAAANPVWYVDSGTWE